MKPEIAALTLHPMHAALLAHHPKKFHIGSMQLFHMTGTQGGYVLVALVILAALAVIVGILRHG